MHATGCFAYPGRQQFLRDQLIVAAAIDTLTGLSLDLATSAIFSGVGLRIPALVGIKMPTTGWHLVTSTAFRILRQPSHSAPRGNKGIHSAVCNIPNPPLKFAPSNTTFFFRKLPLAG
jgi:hypothetical protein